MLRIKVEDFTCYSTYDSHADIKNCSFEFKRNIRLDNSNDSVITNNTDCGSVIVSHSSNNRITGNTAREILLFSSNNNNIMNNTVSNPRDHGIYLSRSSDNVVTNNTVSNSSIYGIYLRLSSNNIVRDKEVSNNQYYGISLRSSNNNAIVGNNVSGNKLHGISLSCSSDNNTITGNNVSSQYNGISLSFDPLWDSTANNSNNTITSNTVSNNKVNGIYLYKSNNNTFINNTICNNTRNGFYFKGSYNNTVTNNTAAENTLSWIYLYYAHNSTISKNTVRDNQQNGIKVKWSTSNTLMSNKVNNSADYGIFLNKSSNNTIYNNYFNNTNNSYDNSNNTWNITKTRGMNIVDGPYRGGNYWCDYKGTNLDAARLGDTLLPYNCSGRIKNGGDWHPLVKIIKGIDVSHYQKDINWSKVYNSGYVSAFVKATEGVDCNDSKFKTNMNEGHDAGMLMGAYHFATPYTNGQNDSVAEAQYFVNESREYLESGYLRPVLDLEHVKGAKKLDTKTLSNWVHEWMNTVRNETGVEPIMYVNSNYARNDLNESVNKYDLWIANYGCYPDKTPDTKECGIWDDWDFWQYTEKGSVPSISSNVDLDIFNGNRSRLNTFIIKKTVKIDLWIEEIKILQTVEDAEDIFVASKPAVVRVFVNGSINSTKEEVVNTKLKLILDGNEIETKDVTVKEQRWYSPINQKQGVNSINFYIPSKHFAIEGTHTVEAIINPNNNPPEANESNNRKTKACNVKKTPKDIFEVEFVALNVGEWDSMNDTELQSYHAPATAN